MFHIDFGHFLGNFKSKYNIKLFFFLKYHDKSLASKTISMISTRNALLGLDGPIEE